MIQHQRIPHFVLQAGLLLLAQLYFSGLGLAAAQPEQHLYAGIQSKLYEFSLDGKFRIYATLPGVLSGFDVDEDGTFWATTGNKLYRVDRHSNEAPATVQNKGVTEFANGLGQCRGMAIGPNGDFWIADRGKGDRSIGIIKIDRQTGEKTLIKEKSDEVKGNIYSVERGPNGNLYASAQSGHTVTEFKPDGTPVRGTPEKPEPLISGHGAAGHRAIVFDVNGDILFIGVDGIERFDSNGTHLGTFFKWTGEGFNDGKLDRADFIARGAKHPMDLAVDQNGIVYGSDNGYDKKKGQEVGGAIYRYNKDGSRDLFFEAGPRPNYLTFWPRTRYSHSPESGALNKSKAADPSESSPNALPSFPDWQCLYVGDFGKACTYKITSDKKVSFYAKDTPNPQNMFFDKDGVLFVACGNGIRTVTPTEDGSPATLANGHVKVLVDGLHHVHGLACDKKGNLWVGTYVGEVTGKKNKKGQPLREQGTVYIVSPDGKLRSICKAYCYSLATDPDGEVYVCIQTGGVLARLSEDGTQTIVAKDFVARGAFFDKDGTAYAVGPGGIRKLTNDGKNTLLVDFEADGYGAMHPFAVIKDANGNFFQSDPPLDKRTNPGASEGFIFQFGPGGGKRSVFLRVGNTPTFMAFWPTSNAATKSKAQ